YLVWKHWEGIKEFFINLWDSPAGQLFRFFTPLGMLINLGVWIYKNWERVKEFFIKMWDNPLVKVLAFVTGIGPLIQAGIDLYNNWDKFSGVLEKIWKGIKWFLGIKDDLPASSDFQFGSKNQSSIDDNQMSHEGGGGDLYSGNGFQSLADANRP